jgi:hypothetical protein
MGDWFKALFGFSERSYEDTQEKLQVQEDTKRPGYYRITSTKTTKTYEAGKFSTPSLAELRTMTNEQKLLDKHTGKLTLTLELGDVSAKQANPDNTHSTFQAASQFNCLEFPSPRCAPENGITGYAYDRTQGPACSISCGPATAFRNYFASVTRDGKTQQGQTSDNQIDNLADVNASIGNIDHEYFRVINGYTLGTDAGLAAMNDVLAQKSDSEMDVLRSLLRIGLHSDVQVTSYNWGRQLLTAPHCISQVFGSACSVAYSHNSSSLWEPISQLVLSASYEATLHAALQAAERHNGTNGSRTVFLTALGGGVFGNDMQWIADAITMACTKFKDTNLDVRVVQYSQPVDGALIRAIQSFAVSQSQ